MCRWKVCWDVCCQARVWDIEVITLRIVATVGSTTHARNKNAMSTITSTINQHRNGARLERTLQLTLREGGVRVTVISWTTKICNRISNLLSGVSIVAHTRWTTS